MDVIAQEEPIRIRKMEANGQDFQQFLKWMTDPQTMWYWEGMTEHFTYERVAEEYRQHVEDGVQPCMIEYRQRSIGYCQFCRIKGADYDVPLKQYERFVRQTEAAYGIDIFLGEVDCRNKGIGTRCLTLLMGALFQQYQADILLIDPKIHNARAIACYHKCGFRDWFVVPQRELQDGIYHDSLIMGIKKADFV